MSNDTVRELFINELEQVSGGGPVEELIERVWPAPVAEPELGGIPTYTTMACCEESNDGCC